jgi:hypothetical protein
MQPHYVCSTTQVVGNLSSRPFILSAVCCVDLFHSRLCHWTLWFSATWFTYGIKTLHPHWCRAWSEWRGVRTSFLELLSLDDIIGFARELLGNFQSEISGQILNLNMDMPRRDRRFERQCDDHCATQTWQRLSRSSKRKKVVGKIWALTKLGPMLWFLNIFAEKFCENLCVFAQVTASFCKKLTITLVFEKNDKIFAENLQKIDL